MAKLDDVRAELLETCSVLPGSQDFYIEWIDALIMHAKKSTDYTGAGDDPFANFKASAQWAGCTPLQAVQMHQGNKIDRLRNLNAMGGDANFESAQDTKRDLMVYLGIELAMRRTDG